MFRYALIILFIQIFCLCLKAEEWLVLESDDGRSIQAKIVGFSDDSVIIVTSNDQRFTVPLARFSPSSQNVINTHRSGVEAANQKVDQIIAKLMEDLQKPFTYRVDHLPSFDAFFTEAAPVSGAYVRWRAFRAARAQHIQRRDTFARRYESFIQDTWPGVVVGRENILISHYFYQNPKLEIPGQLNMDSLALLQRITDDRNPHNGHLRDWARGRPTPVDHFLKIMENAQSELAGHVDSSDQARRMHQRVGEFLQIWNGYFDTSLNDNQVTLQRRNLRRTLREMGINF